MRARGLLKARGRQRTDSTHVLAAIRALNRLELVGETLRHALNSLAAVVSDWLRTQVPPEWFDRYGTRIENYRLPQTTAARAELAVTIGVDGRRLQQAVEGATDLPWLREMPAVKTLLLVTAQTAYQIDVVGPTFGSYSRQRLTDQGYDLAAFVINWEAKHARCPRG